MAVTEASAAQKFYYIGVLQPLWLGQLDQLGDAQREYRYHLLAVECLRRAKGPGADPLRISEFCRTWKIPATLPVIGPTALLRKIGRLAGGWPSAAAIFDPTGALNLGFKVIGAMAPLIGKIQMRNALLFAIDDSVVESGDQGDVGSILEGCKTPQELINRLQGAKNKVERVWKETTALAEKMEPIRKEVGLPETLS